MWKDCFINMVKHEIKKTKPIFIYKTIYGTTQCMKFFQDAKGFLHKTYPFQTLKLDSHLPPKIALFA